MRAQEAAQIRKGIHLARTRGLDVMTHVRDQEPVLTLRAYLHTLTRNEPKQERP